MYRDFYYTNKTVVIPFYFFNGIGYPGDMVSLYQNDPALKQNVIDVSISCSELLPAAGGERMSHQ